MASINWRKILALLSSKKEFVVFGCSMLADYIGWRNHMAKRYPGYAKFPARKIEEDGSYSKDWDWVKWEEIDRIKTVDDVLAPNFEMTGVNKAYPGSGNQQIFNTLIDYVSERRNKIGFVMIGWTNSTRMSFRSINNNNAEDKGGYFTLFPADAQEGLSGEDVQELFRVLDQHGLVDIRAMIENDIRLQWVAQEFMKTTGIPFMMASALNTSGWHGGLGQDRVDRLIQLNNHFNRLDVETYYGWPILGSVGGDFLCADMGEDCVLNKHDRHLNQIGVNYVADKILNFIQERKLL